ncbi:hypothetical protein LXL04_001412 [Taraxacum kok-saghyz]
MSIYLFKPRQLFCISKPKSYRHRFTTAMVYYFVNGEWFVPPTQYASPSFTISTTASPSSPIKDVLNDHHSFYAKIQQDAEDEYNYCVYDSDISTGYGLGAFFLLLASQIIIMVANRCFCCGKALNPTGSRVCAVILFIFCWLSFGNKVCFSAKRVGRLALWESNEKGKEEWRWIDNVPGHGDGLYRGFLFDARLDASP